MNYDEQMKSKLADLKQKKNIIVLGIESSCDETAAAVTIGNTVLSSIISSQIATHLEYGGVVPEIASRKHSTNIGEVVKAALVGAKMTINEVDAVAVTYGAGLQGALLVGIAYAKALAYAAAKPLIAVNHIEAHISANYIAHPELTPPYLCIIASGGHTALAIVREYNKIEIIGSTTDDACGEAFDKVARVLGLPYPGGPKVEKIAEGGANIVPMPRPYKNENHYNFSYSGLKTAVINYTHKCEQNNEEYNKADLACSFQTAAIGMLCENAMRAASEFSLKDIAIAGGVGANGYFRKTLSELCEARGMRAFFPPKILCTDNAVMICSNAYRQIMFGNASPAELSLDAKPSIPLAKNNQTN